jgi:hypothetical protein
MIQWIARLETKQSKIAFSYFAATTEDRKPSGTGATVKTKTTVSHKGKEKKSTSLTQQEAWAPR